MSQEEIEKLIVEKASLIDEFISLKKKYQELFYKHEEMKTENKHLKRKICELQKENNELNQSDTNVHRQNKKLMAKVTQMRRSIHATPQKSPIKYEKKNETGKTKEDEEEEEDGQYEIEKLMKHRGRAGDREFLVRWKNFGKENDTLVKEANLSCPRLLKPYKNKHRIA